MKHQMLNAKKFLGQGLTHTLCNVLLRQLFFLSAAIFLFFSFTFLVNAFSLIYRTFPEVSYDLIHIVVFSPVVDSAVFYLSSIFILLFPLLSRGWTRSWKWAVASYLPLSLSLAGFLFQITAAGQVFLSLSCILCLLWIFVHLATHHWCGFQTKTGVANILLYVCIIFLFIEIFSFFFWLQFPFLGVNELGGFFQQMAMVELQFFYVPAFLTPFLVLFTLFAWVLIPFQLWLKKVRTLILRFAGKEVDLKKTLSVNLSFSGFKVLDRKPWSMLFLVMSLLLSVIYGFYAYHPVLFGSEQFIGVDTSHYVTFLEDMRRGDVLYALSYAFFNLSDRSLSASILYCFSIFFGLPSTVVAQFSPLVIVPLVVFATYFFMREAGFPDNVCVISGFFSSFSFLMTVGVYTAFISNMMAWLAVLFFSGLLVKSLRSHSKVFCFLAAFTLVLVLFLHVYTWSFMIITLGCLVFFYSLRHVSGSSSMPKLKLASVITVSNVIAEFVRGFVRKSESVAVESGLNLVRVGVSLSFVWYFWTRLNVMLNTYLCGFFMNPVMFFLVAIGVLTVVFDMWQKDFCLLVKCWVIVSSFFFIFGDRVVQARIMYALPFHVLATFGIIFFECWIRRFFKGSVGRVLVVLFVLFLLLVNVNYALRSMNIISMLDFS